MESCKADVQRLSLLIKEALRNITNYPKEQKGGSAQLKGEIPAGKLGSALLLVLLYYNLVLLQINVIFCFFWSKTGKKKVWKMLLIVKEVFRLQMKCTISFKIESLK